MDGMFPGLFILAAFAGGFVSGFSGFAMGLGVSGIWLYIITPLQTAALIAGYGLLAQARRPVVDRDGMQGPRSLTRALHGGFMERHSLGIA